MQSTLKGTAMATPEQRNALLAGCLETTLVDEVGDELTDAGIDIPELADRLLERLYSRLRDIPTEALLADAMRFGLLPERRVKRIGLPQRIGDVYRIERSEPE
jgi:hypothetical protein